MSNRTVRSPKDFQRDERQITRTRCGLMRYMSIKNLHTQGDSNGISMPAGFRRHLVGKTLINVFHCNITVIRFVGKLVIIQIFS